MAPLSTAGYTETIPMVNNNATGVASTAPAMNMFNLQAPLSNGHNQYSQPVNATLFDELSELQNYQVSSTSSVHNQTENYMTRTDGPIGFTEGQSSTPRINLTSTDHIDDELNFLLSEFEDRGVSNNAGEGSRLNSAYQNNFSVPQSNYNQSDYHVNNTVTSAVNAERSQWMPPASNNGFNQNDYTMSNSSDACRSDLSRPQVPSQQTRQCQMDYLVSSQSSLAVPSQPPPQPQLQSQHQHQAQAQLQHQLPPPQNPQPQHQFPPPTQPQHQLPPKPQPPLQHQVQVQPQPLQQLRPNPQPQLQHQTQPQPQPQHQFPPPTQPQHQLPPKPQPPLQHQVQVQPQPLQELRPNPQPQLQHQTQPQPQPQPQQMTNPNNYQINNPDSNRLVEAPNSQLNQVVPTNGYYHAAPDNFSQTSERINITSHHFEVNGNNHQQYNAKSNTLRMRLREIQKSLLPRRPSPPLPPPPAKVAEPTNYIQDVAQTTIVNPDYQCTNNQQQHQQQQHQQQQIQQQQQQQQQQQIQQQQLREVYNERMKPAGRFSKQPYPEFWCSATYFEQDVKVCDTFMVKSSYRRFVIDGFVDPSGGNRFCLGALSNCMRQPASERTRLYIGKGVHLEWQGEGDVVLTNMGDHSIFLQSKYLDSRSGHDEFLSNQVIVHKIHPSGVVKVFDLSYSYTMIKTIVSNQQKLNFRRAITVAGRRLFRMDKKSEEDDKKGDPVAGASVDHLRKYCCIRFSFVKGWGPDYQRAEIKDTPCWVEVQLHRALQILDEILEPSSRKISSSSSTSSSSKSDIQCVPNGQRT